MPFYDELLHLVHCLLWEQFMTREEENKVVQRHLSCLFLKLCVEEYISKNTWYYTSHDLKWNKMTLWVLNSRSRNKSFCTRIPMKYWRWTWGDQLTRWRNKQWALIEVDNPRWNSRCRCFQERAREAVYCLIQNSGEILPRSLSSLSKNV